MVTLFLQLAGSLLTALFGFLCLAVARRSEGHPSERRSAWLLTALCYVPMGVHVTLQSIFAVAAFFHPSDSPIRVAFRSWVSVGNDGRSFLIFGFTVLLLGLLLTRRLTPPPPAAGVLGWLILWLAGGSVVGFLESPLGDSHHYSTITYLSAVTVMVLMAALLTAVVRDQMDYLLWSALALYTLREAIDVSLTSGFSFLNVPGAWIPSFGSMQALVVVCYTLMCLLAWKRLMMAGKNVPALFELDGSSGRPGTGSPDDKLRSRPHGIP
jgi:hypothetical protein